MSDTTDKTLTPEDLTAAQPPSTDPAYLAWKKAEIRAAIKDANANPDDFESLDEMRKRLGLDR